MNKENIITQIKKNSNEVYRISEKEYEKICINQFNKIYVYKAKRHE